MENKKSYNYKTVFWGIILSLLVILGTKLESCKKEPEITSEQPKALQFTYKPMKELDGDTLRVYYTSFEINQNGKFKTWKTEKIYLK